MARSTTTEIAASTIAIPYDPAWLKFS
jgi:hypothetical protein